MSRYDTSHLHHNPTWPTRLPAMQFPFKFVIWKKNKISNLQGHEGGDTGDNGTEGDDVAASSVESGGGRRLSGASGSGSAGGDNVGGALQGAGAGRANDDTGGRSSRGRGGGGLGANGGGNLPRADDGGGGSNGSGLGSGGGAGLILGAVGGGDIVDDGDDGQLGGRGSGGGRLGSLGGGDGGRGRGGGGALSLGETELGRPLVGTVVGTGVLDDDQETVVGDIGGQVGAGGPDELARVGDALSEGRDGDDVGGRSTEEDDGDGVAEVVIPLDGVGLALGDLLVQTGGADGVTLGRLGVVGGGVGSSEGREGGDESSSGETHCDGMGVI